MTEEVTTSNQIMTVKSLGFLTNLMLQTDLYFGVGTGVNLLNTLQNSLAQEIQSGYFDQNGNNCRIPAILTQTSGLLPLDTIQASATILWGAETATIKEIGLFTNNGVVTYDVGVVSIYPNNEGAGSIIVGTGTTWKQSGIASRFSIRFGDIHGQWYLIESVNSDTSITIQGDYPLVGETPVLNIPYLIQTGGGGNPSGGDLIATAQLNPGITLFSGSPPVQDQATVTLNLRFPLNG